MFTESDYVAARVRDAARWMNEALARADEVGLTVSLRLSDREPHRIEVAVQRDMPLGAHASMNGSTAAPNTVALVRARPPAQS